MKRTAKTAFNGGRGREIAFKGEKGGQGAGAGWRQNGGSTIVGVLAALVFITVVAAFMVKNTGAQAAASVGYTTDLTMHSTVYSGVMATESFCLNSADSVNKVLLRYVKENGGGNNYFIFGKNAKAKERLNANQFFSSELLEYKRFDKTAQFVVNSAKSGSGKSMKKASVFYNLRNSYIKTSSRRHKNAFFLGGSLVDGNVGLEAYGDVTIAGDAKFQNYAGVFHGEAYFGGNVNIQHPGTIFHDKVYVEGNAVFQNFSATHTVFENGVGLNGNFSTEGNANPIRVDGNVYLKGDMLGSNSTIKSVGGGDTLFHTEQLKVANDSCKAQNNRNEACALHGVLANGHITASRMQDFAATQDKGTADALSSQKILQSMEMSPIEDRKDPQLDISKIPDKYIKNAYESVSRSGGNFDVNKLNESYAAAQENNELFMGHLVLKVGKDDPMLNWPSTTANSTFNDKVIFIIEDDSQKFGNVAGSFYNSGPESTTLIYVGGGDAHLSEFGTSGLFRGYIYVDEANTIGIPPNNMKNSFNWKDGSSIQGAVHNFSSGPFLWNAGNPTPIHFDEDVLNEYSAIIRDADGGGDDEASFVEIDDPRIYPIPGGFYFY
ncbi:MAG: hypothetical protein LBH93_07125 [Chitinispirillales bacterium]|nr:hypothetical protein [Chitinispirillales bacterium]